MLRELACHQHLVPHRWVTLVTCLPCPQELACHQHLVPQCWVTPLTLMHSPHLPAAQHASCARLHQIKYVSQSAPSRSGVQHMLHGRFWSPAGNHRSIHDVCVQWSLPMFPCDVTKLSACNGRCLAICCRCLSLASPCLLFAFFLVCLLNCFCSCLLAGLRCLFACLLACLVAGSLANCFCLFIWSCYFCGSGFPPRSALWPCLLTSNNIPLRCPCVWTCSQCGAQ